MAKRLVDVGKGQQIEISAPRFYPPWALRALGRRMQRLETYHQLTARATAYDEASIEHRQARAQLEAQIALDQIGAAERNTNTIALATWALVAMTAALVVATVALIVVTAVR